MTKVEEQGKGLGNWPAGAGVCAAASPGPGRKRREKLPSAERRFGDPMAQNRSPGSIG